MVKHLLLSCILPASYLYASDSLSSILDDSTSYKNIRYYYIQTDKQNSLSNIDSSAKANSIGGQIGLKTGSYYGFNAQITLMTTNGFSLGNSVDSSILSRDDAVRLNGSPASDLAQESFSVLGEAFLTYSTDNFDINYGRQILKTPLVHAKEVRLLPTSVEGSVLHYNLYENKLNFEAAYVTKFKQRTSNTFINIVEHALGNHNESITGSTDNALIYANLSWSDDDYTIRLQDYYAQDFLHSFYADIDYKNTFDTFHYTLSAQAIAQRSIGNADTNLALLNSATQGKKIDSKALGLKATLSYEESNFMLGYSYVASDDNAHDSLVLPWDGTPLYTNMITSNNLFGSNYGKGLTADSIYIGGTQAFKVGYTQSYDFTGIKGFKTSLSYMLATNDKFNKGSQKDLNVVLSYTYNKNFSIDLKGIFVTNNTSSKANGDINQLDDFQQYRIIANYRF